MGSDPSVEYLMNCVTVITRADPIEHGADVAPSIAIHTSVRRTR